MLVHVNSEPLTEIMREPDAPERWCFRCRKRRPFVYVVLAPVDMMSYYGPTPSVRCAICDTIDGDLFPGHQREWEGA